MEKPQLPEDHPGYSTVKEREYVMNPFCQIPLLKFLTPEITTRYNIVLEGYRSWLKAFKMSPNASTTYPLFVDHMRYRENAKVFKLAGKKHIKFQFENKFCRIFLNLIGMMKQAIRDVANQGAAAEAPVTFSYAHTTTEEGVVSRVKARASEEAKLARLVQRDLKDAQHPFLASLNKPILDLGGGANNLERAIRNRGIEKPMKIDVVDIIRDPQDDMNKINAADYPEHHFLSNHSSYHMHPSKWVEIVKTNPSGLVLVADSNEDEFTVNGSDYTFTGKKLQGINVEAYEVSGNIFNIRTSQTIGRVFTSEIWYTRNQWVKWGFDLYMLPGITSDFVLRHVVLFNKGVKHRPMIQGFTPSPIRLSESEDNAFVKNKQPRIHQLGTYDRSKEVAALYGQPIYQTPKLDGISLKLTINNRNFVQLTDRTGVSYRMKNLSGKDLVVTTFSDIELMVEILPINVSKEKGNVQVGGQYLIYLNQVVKGFGSNYTSFADEIDETVTAFNKMFRNCKPLGRKEAWLTKNSVLKWQSKLPHDGVVYVPAIATSSWLNPYSYPIHTFVKPFSGTDTSPYIINAEQVRLYNSRPFSVLYRDDGNKLLTNCPHSTDIRKIFKSNVINPNDFYGDQNMSPLLYEGYMVPRGVISETDTFIVTHVRGDKIKRDCMMKPVSNEDWLETGRFCFTKFGNNAQEVLDYFLNSLNSARRVKVLPSFVCKYSDFVDNFIKAWHAGNSYDFRYLNKFVVEGVFNASADDLVKGLKLALDPNVALFVASTLFRYPHVKRQLDVRGNKIFTWVSFSITSGFKPPDASMVYDAFGTSAPVDTI